MDLRSYVTLGRTGLRVSPLCLGAMTFASPGCGTDEDTAHRIMSRYVDAGGNFVDTANAYAGGRSEEIIGSFLSGGAVRRDQLVIGTKFAGNLFAGDPNGGGAGRKAIHQQVDASLRRLGTDYIDLYWMHNHDRHTPLVETMATLDDLVRAGKIRYIGLSDTPAWAVARMATIAEFRGWSGIAAIQVEYSLLQRTVEGELFGVASELGLGVMPWSPLAAGLLSGKYTRERSAPEDATRSAAWHGTRLDERTFTLVDRLQEIAGRLGTSVAVVALAWVRQQAAVTSTIIGVRTLPQLEQNLASLDLEVPADDVAQLSRMSAPTLDFPAAFLATNAPTYQQNGTTINGVPSTAR